MQSVSSRIWTRIAVFISYGDNDYTAGILSIRYEEVLFIFFRVFFILSKTHNRIEINL